MSDELQYFLARRGFSEERIRRMSSETCIVNDLRLNGDHLCEFIKIWGRELGVDLSLFQPGNYTQSEGEYLFPSPIIRWLYRTPKVTYRRLPLAVLDASMAQRHWTDP